MDQVDTPQTPPPTVPPRPAPPPAFKTLQWGGLDLANLQLVEHLFCRTHHRVTRYGGDDEKVLKYGYAGLAGKLIGALFDHLDPKQFAGFPTLGQLADTVSPPVQQNVLKSKFFVGQATAGTDWFKHAKGLLWLLLMGADPETSGERYDVARRVRSFFFRDMPKGAPNGPSSFFAPWRLRLAHPASRGELAREVSWFTRSQQRLGGATEVVWVSGATPFFQSGSGLKRMTHAIAEASAAGVRVTFAFPCGDPANGIAANLGQFFVDHPEAKHPEPPAVFDLSPFCPLGCSPVDSQQYLYLRHAYKDKDSEDGEQVEEVLYILRDDGGRDDEEDEGKKKAPVPLTITANAAELDSFRRWWQRLQSRAVPVPMPVPPAPPVDAAEVPATA